MGAVYEAFVPDIEQRVALKVLTVDRSKHPSFGQRFLNEARAANKIKHPGVVKVHDFGQMEDGTPWLAMEFVEGTSLASRIEDMLKTSGRPSSTELLWVVGELASILRAAHEQKIIHRDLKPQNVMLVPDPRALNGESVKLLDFGIAKLHGDQLTRSNVLLGTPSYMAPEQFKGAGGVDERADTYALGTIAYELLCGRLPFLGDSAYELMGAKCMDFPIPISQHAPELPADLQALVMSLIERDPARRPSLQHLEEEVRRMLALPPPRTRGSQDGLPAPSESQSGERGKAPLRVTTLSSAAGLSLNRTPPNRRRFYALAGLGAAALVAGAIGLRMGVFATAQPAHPIADLSVAVAAQATSVVDMAAPPIDLAVPNDLMPPNRDQNSPIPVASRRSSSSTSQTCRSSDQLPVTSACIQTSLPAAERDQILASFSRTGVRLCPGERMIIADINTKPRLRVAPPSLRNDAQLALMFALRGLLKSKQMPSEVEIKCPKG